MPERQHAHMTVRRGASFSAYLLDAEEVFSPSGYKLLNSQRGVGLIPCLCSRFNGKIKLTYFPDHLVPIQSCMADISANEFMALVGGLVEAIVRVDSNGLFDISKIDMSMDAFYIDVESYETGVIYLPVNHRVFGDNKQEAFNLLCQTILMCMGSHDQLKPLIRTMAGFANTSRGRFDYLLKKIKNSYPSHALSTGLAQQAMEEDIDSRLYPPSVSESTVQRGSYKLVGKTAAGPLEIAIDDGAHVLGKSKLNAYYVIGDVPTISNRHCELISTTTGLLVRDLGSTNGTFVNGRRLSTNVQTELFVGDVLSTSSLELMVCEVN